MDDILTDIKYFITEKQGLHKVEVEAVKKTSDAIRGLKAALVRGWV